MFNTILIISPHTDDGELGCGGAIAKFIEKRKNIFYLALSACEESVPKHLPPSILKREVMKATKSLCIPSQNVIVKNYRVRHLLRHRQEVLEDLVHVRDLIKPDLVFTPALNDVHQDHQVVAQETLRAFRYVSILGYELPWNNTSFPATFFIHLEEKHIRKKVKALARYASQKHRPYMNESFIRSLATVRGIQANTRFAEAFYLIKWQLTNF